ncbi:MAG: DEAD/DEAH box helicase family protein [Desulfatibacillaceae bacterium]|nr:DEAD/DEAH box helicase family protein [Desulfatibacillaceae bacterium]
MEKPLEILVDSKIRMSGEISPALQVELVRCLSMPNPAWMEKRKYGRWCQDTPKRLTFFVRREPFMWMPRGFAASLLGLLKEHGHSFVVQDMTRQLPPVDFNFEAELFDFQQDAANKILGKRFTVVELPTGAGKTVIALYCIAQRRQPACVIVHTRELLHQWLDRAQHFLGLDRSRIGLVGDGFRELGRPLTLCLVNTLYQCAREVAATTGFLVVDECHRVPSRTFTHAVKAFNSRYMLGLSATPFRRDGLTDLIHLYMGDSVGRCARQVVRRQGVITGARLVVRKTGFDYPYQDDYQALVCALTEDGQRNRLIAKDAALFRQKTGRTALVVSDRKEHCRTLAGLVDAMGQRVALLTGDCSATQRRAVVEQACAGELDVLVATLQLIGEGFDCSALAGLFLATPVRFSGRVLQVVGRVVRTAPGKQTAWIYDYVDEPGVLASSFASRQKVYASLGVNL